MLRLRWLAHAVTSAWIKDSFKELGWIPRSILHEEGISGEGNFGVKF
jgi:hypothetical protein